MDNSDDYFQDSFDLDENDLALLEAEEAKYVETVSQTPSRLSETLPPRKRQKVTHPHDSEDIPDVFLQPDGTYGVAAVMRQENEEGDIPVPKTLFASEQETMTRTLQSNTFSDTQTPQSLRRQISTPMRNLRSSVQLGRSLSRAVPSVPAKQRLQTIPKERRLPPPQRTGTQPDPMRAYPPVPTYDGEITALKAIVEKLKIENGEANKALQDAEVTRFAKDGEAAILRKKLEKAAQQHAEVLAKLKETRDSAILEQGRIQKEMKEQIERLRTEYIFKQHEIEASTRKPAWSSRSKRMALGPQMSPVPLPPAMRDWTSSNAVGPSRNGFFQETPSRRAKTFEGHTQNLPKVGVKGRPGSSELKFPGFENSFLPSSPSNSPTRSRQATNARCNTPTLGTPQKVKKGKAKEGTPGRRKSPVKPPALTLRPASGGGSGGLPIDDSIQDFGDVEINDGSPRRHSRIPRTESSPGLGQSGLDSAGDFDFSDEADRDSPKEGSIFEGIDWSEELHYMLFSHTCTVSKTLTFHLLLSVNISNQEYQQACSGILEALGLKYRFVTLHKLMEAVAEKLLSMAIILWKSEHFRHLRALFELLSSIVAYIPSFTSALLQPGLDGKRCDHELLRICCGIALKSLDFKDAKCDDGESFTSLLQSTLLLLEMVVWTVPELFCSSLVSLLQTDRVLFALLDNKQPYSVLSRTISFLLVVASHPSLSQALLSLPREQPQNQLKKSNTSNSLLERLAGLLTDPSPLSNIDVDRDLSSILSFFALLMSSGLGSRATLLRSTTLVPCLIHYLTRLTTMIWEDDEKFMSSPERAKSITHNMKQALLLLHQLVVPTSISVDQDVSDFDFRQKLFHAPHTMFNGLTHMFVVMIGRLSYADPPDWLDVDLQAEIEKLTEPARDLMELIIEGPEGDSVWVAYQDTEGKSVTEDDDEFQAHLLDAEQSI